MTEVGPRLCEEESPRMTKREPWTKDEEIINEVLRALAWSLFLPVRSLPQNWVTRKISPMTTHSQRCPLQEHCVAGHEGTPRDIR